MTSSSTELLLADRVWRNDPDLQHLYLSSDSTPDAQSLIRALASSNNAQLQHIYFRNFKLSGDSSLPLLLEAIGHLSHLKSVFFHCSEVPIALLGRVLFTESRTCTQVGLRYCQLKYETELEWREFEAAARQNVILEDICLECCEWQVEQGRQEEHDDDYNLSKTSSFLQAIACIPALVHVECVLPATNNHRQRLPVQAFACLGQIPQLQSLRLRNVWLPQSDVALLCHCCLGGGLKKLILSCDMGPTSALALGQLLQDSPCLEQLALRMDRLEDPDSPLLLAQALQWQPGHRLEHFHLSGPAACQISPRAKRAFRDMMQTNISLEFVRLEVADYALQSEIAFYLQLNHKGRRALFQKLDSPQQPESALWVQALAENAGDLRALHYFVALHPGLFATAALEAHQRKQEEHCNVQTTQQQILYDWEAEDGIVYDSDGW